MAEIPSPQDLVQGHARLVSALALQRSMYSDSDLRIDPTKLDDYRSVAVLIDVVDQCLDEIVLHPRDRAIIHRLYGIPAQSETPSRDVAKEFSLSENRIKQINDKVLRRLKHPSRFRSLIPFFQTG